MKTAQHTPGPFRFDGHGINDAAKKWLSAAIAKATGEI
jgi:hypothetical protein